MVLKSKRVVNPVLTKLSQGYSNAAYVGKYLFPETEVEKEGLQIPQFGADHFKLWQTKRAPRAKSNRGEISDPSMVDVVLQEHDFELPIDTREKDESMFPEERKKAKATQDVLELGKEYAQASLAQNPDNYPSGHKVTLTSTDKWSNHVEDSNLSDPLSDVETGKEVIRGKIGRRPNVAIMGASCYADLKFHPGLLKKLETTRKGIITIDDLKELFGIPNIYIGEAVYANDAGVLGNDVWGESFQMACVPQQEPSERDAEEPCFGRTLKKKGYPETDSYVENGGKVQLVRNTDIYKVAMTGAVAGYIISDTH
ncbi:MAG: hypothetical protein HY817_01530 [Candidatus Abawacabacteria bacterium]|nr:hypothetical protein [Candidatus Abawacabacteria bacterium]